MENRKHILNCKLGLGSPVQLLVSCLRKTKMGRKQIGKTVQLHALILTQQEDEDPWKCKICSKMFKDHDAKLLECQRCNEHFCIKCLGKKPAEYDILSNSDTMWFCGLCKERVVKNIVTQKNRGSIQPNP